MFDLTTVVQGVAFVLATTLITLATNFAVRWLYRASADSDTKELASSVLIRVGALFALILALVFAQENLDHDRIRINIIGEATALADIYNDIGRYGTDQQSKVQAAVAAYAHLVADREWEELALANRLLPEAWQLRETIYQALLESEIGKN